MNQKSVSAWLKVLCVIFIIIGVIFLCIGFYKMFRYDNSIYGDYVNAYVEGDAYNYIINGTYFTAYAVLGMGSLIIAAITGVSGAVLSIEKEEVKEVEEKLPSL